MFCLNTWQLHLEVRATRTLWPSPPVVSNARKHRNCGCLRTLVSALFVKGFVCDGTIHSSPQPPCATPFETCSKGKTAIFLRFPVVSVAVPSAPRIQPSPGLGGKRAGSGACGASEFRSSHSWCTSDLTHVLSSSEQPASCQPRVQCTAKPWLHSLRSVPL